jgi:ABC-type thiamin/hydroxymethylpyrimidine transport system permease subunit
MHQILAHDPQFSISAIVNRFIDGLAPEIRSIVFIHRPLDLDTAVSLALL